MSTEFKNQQLKHHNITRKNTKRDTKDIIYDILKYLLDNGQKGQHTKTKICYMSQLPYHLFNPIFVMLLEKKLITLQSTQIFKTKKEIHMFKITQLGNDYINKYQMLMGMLGREFKK